MVGASAGTTAAPSRYKSDFEEVEYVGHGGFGQVVKARNKLDGRVYAIKTVRLSRDDNENRKLLREVRTLSRLSSVRCVRYYQAWIEDAQGMWMEGSSDEDDDGTSCGNDIESSESESESSSDDESRGGSDDDDDDDDESEEDSTSAGNGPFWATRPSSSGTDSSSSGFSTSDSSGRDNVAAMNEARLMFASDPDDELDWISFDRSKSFKRRPQQPKYGKGAASRRASTDSESESDSEPSPRRGRGRGRPGPGPGPRAIPVPQRRRTRTGTTRSSGDAASGDSLGSSQKNLFIQMEYCENRTLSDVIEQGITPNEAWRLFHQIVEGLVHIHSQGMIHRDVKPKNIFLDADNNVKIGDFGLATTFLFTAAQSLDVLEGSMGNLNVSRGAGMVPRPIPGTEIKIEDTQRSLTSDVGTALYVAPELKSGHSKYNQKVDIYSLGIILFELFHRFSTGMERATTLLRLRQPEIIFPPEFPESPQKCLIQWLLNHDPRQRPTSMEVLQSHLLPTTFEDEVLQEAMRAMTNPANTTHYSKLIHSLFSHAPDPLKDFTYDDPQPLDAQAMRSLTCVQDVVTRVFRLHGAVAFNAPLLAPTNEMYAGKRMAQFVDAHGQLVMLPFDLTVPFARWVARNPVQMLTRRFAWGNVYRENGLGGQPRAVLEADFDIVAPAPRRGVDGTVKNGTAADPVVAALRTDQLAMEAEVIYVMTQVLDAFPPLRQRPLGARAGPPSRPVGSCFQARINAPGQRADVIASGGRYDALVAQFAHPARRATVGPQSPSSSAAGAVAAPVVACGVHVAVQKLAWIHRQRFPKSTATQVVVASFGTGLLTERMKLAKELWQAGVACEYLYEENTPADMVAQQCKLKGIAAIIFVKSDSASGTVKVRHIKSKVETDVPRATVVDHVARLVGADAAAAAEAGHLVVTSAALGGGLWTGGAAPAVAAGPGSPMQLNTNHHHGHGHGHHHGYHHAPPAPAASGPASIITSTAVMKKLKHKQRQMILEKAVASVGRGIGDVVASPVLAVYSLSLPALRALAADLSRNQGSGTAATTLTDLPLSSADRELVQQVVAAVGKLKAAGHRFCFLYSVLQDAHCVVSLG
ncbi:PEK/GCN2 protein kinase [Allomyces macrogynus ATCC 38327]|uniref:PEK/GCN2 protein kinase n=1 Tax=Allomyces macrogynus (strain ATCC 38327) TaxID=578462 RepID=A0A0L0S140_ALLM3|nr:PEK/GCN2 protein kinase [Allomyces macrogynus ATCC 38327]|eukprot:KNE56307.1 PEK/GCN2 protein kinase [Allomyces macrogynus ATCC 38327]